MHDPMVVAMDIPRPWPKRQQKLSTGPQWQARYGWAKWYDLRPSSFMRFSTLAGRRYYWPSTVTIWHVEPDERDALTVCHGKHWKSHVHHWKIQVHLLGRIKRFLFERCQECGRRFPYGYAPVSHQWDEPSAPWFKVTRRAYHHECSALVSARRTQSMDEVIVKGLVETLATNTGLEEPALVASLTDVNNQAWEFAHAYRFQRLMGYERDGDYNLRKKGTS